LTAILCHVGQNNRRTPSLRFLLAHIKSTPVISQRSIQKFTYCLERPKNERDTCWDVKAVLMGLGRLKHSLTSLHLEARKARVISKG